MKKLTFDNVVGWTCIFVLTFLVTHQFLLHFCLTYRQYLLSQTLDHFQDHQYAFWHFLWAF